MSDLSRHLSHGVSGKLETDAPGLRRTLLNQFRQDLAKRSRSVYVDPPSPLMVPSDTPVSTDAYSSLDQTSLPEIQHCPNCGTAMDVTDLEPLARVTCPSCQTRFSISSELLHFRLTSVLGHGGMGNVFKAYDNSLGRYVALKLLRSDFTANAEYLERLHNEAGIMAQLSHPNVVRVFSIGSDRGRFFLAMELVEHGTLDDVLQNQGQLAEVQALDLGIQAARGLQAAYEAGVLHRDVKPGNILFVDAQTVKITDFGLAESADQATSASEEIIGTPYYIAPERLHREREDCRSDIYSLGATLFHTIAGRPPFEAEDATAVALKRLKSQPASLATYAPHISGSTAFVINRTLHKDPAKRYQSYDELIEHLEYARNELLNTTGKPQARARVVLEDEEQQKLWAWISIGMLAVVALAAGAFFLFWKTSEPAEKTAPTTAETSKQSGEAAQFTEASDLLARGQFGKAADAFRSIAAKNPKAQPLRSWSLLYSGVAELFAGRAIEADTALNKIGSQQLGKIPNSEQLSELFTKVARASTLEQNDVDAFAKQLDANSPEIVGLLVLGLKSSLNGDVDRAITLLREYRSAESTIQKGEWFVELRAPVTTLLGQAAAFQILNQRYKKETSPQGKFTLLNELREVHGPYERHAQKLLTSLETEVAEIQAKYETYPKAGVYRLINRKSGKAMEVNGGSLKDDAVIVQGTVNPTKAHQEWILWPLGYGEYRLEVRHTRKMLDLFKNSSDEGTQVGQWNRNDGLPQQRWKLEKHSDDSFSIIAATTGKVLTVKDGSTVEGAEILEFSDRGALEQRWTIEPPTPPATFQAGTYMFLNAHSGLVVDVKDRKKEDGVIMLQWASSNEGHQRFQITPLEDGYYKIQAVHSGKVMDVSARSTNDGAKVHQWAWVPVDNQRWKITHEGDNRYRLSPKHAPDKVLALKNKSTAKDDELVISTAKQSPDEYWILVPDVPKP